MKDLGVELAKTIALAMIERYKLSRQKLREEYEKQGYKIVFAHELSQCSRKPVMADQLQALDLSVSWKPAVLLGEVVERGIEKYLTSLGFSPPSKPWSKIVSANGEMYVVVGSPDFVDNVEKPYRVVDVKYTASQPSVKDHHIVRMRVYLWLTGAQEGILLYVSPEGLKSYTVIETMTDREVASLIETRPAPMWDWECKLCPFESYCNQAVRGGKSG